METDSLLRDGRELSNYERQSVEKLTQGDVIQQFGSDHLCTIDEYTYINCVDEADDDYLSVRKSTCDQQIRVSEGEGKARCPGCSRTIHLSEKKMHSGYELSLNENGIRKFIRDLCKEATGDSVQKRDGTLTYLNHDFSSANVVQLEGEPVITPVVTERVSRDVLKMARVVNDNLLWILVDEATSLKGWMNRLGLHCITLGDVLNGTPEEAVEAVRRSLDDISEETDQTHLDTATSAAIELCSERRTLKQMGWYEFEHAVQTMLVSSLGTSYILGGTERGSGEPDGALTLHWAKESLFMWDAKFVNLSKNDETKLKGEYDKILRHLRRMDGQQRYKQAFGGVSGILLFTPGIKQANIRRLAEVIHEQEMSQPKRWNGSVVYFELDALIELTEAVNENRGEVRNKPNLFRKALHANLTSPSKHENDPEKVYSADYTSLHMSVEDIKEMFEFIASQSSEHTEFKREEYVESASYFNDV